MGRLRTLLALLAAASLAGTISIGAASVARATAVAPAVGDCLALDLQRVGSATEPVMFVSCSSKHASEVFAVAAYPANAGAPSTIADRVWELFGSQCSSAVLAQWIKGFPVNMATAISRNFTLPSDDQWRAGARWVLCRTIRLGSSLSPISYAGALPKLFASTPLLGWLLCTKNKPMTARWNVSAPCSSGSVWLNIGGVDIVGQAGNPYPGALQKEADGKCAKAAKPVLAKGSPVLPVAALAPKEDFVNGSPFAECFIPVKEWNGKTR